MIKLTDSEIKEAFDQSNFGNVDHRKLLEQGVLKIQAGYSTGYTLEVILRELGFLTPTGRLSKKGSMFLFESFEDRGIYKDRHKNVE